MRTSRLGNHVEILSGFAFKSGRFNTDGKGLPLVRIRDVKPAQSGTYFDGDYDERFTLSDGDLLVGMDGEFNCARWKGGRALLNQRVCRIRSGSAELDEQYLFWFLPKALKDIEDKSNFVTVKHLSAKQIDEIEIPLPPLDEQKRIAAILDQADELRRKRQRTIDRVNQLGQAIFYEMFGDPITNRFGWPKAPIKKTDIKIADGNYSSKYPTKDDFVVDGVPFIRANNMKSGAVIDDDMRFISRKKHEELKKGHLKAGDILITTRGQIGNVSLVPQCHENSNINAQIVLLRPTSKKIESSFLFGLLSTKSMQNIFESLQTGVALKQLPVGKLKDVEIILPPHERQIEFAATNRVLANMQAQAIVSMERANMLFSSLQHRAFQGEL